MVKSRKASDTESASAPVGHQAEAAAVVRKYIPWSMGLGFVPAPLLVAAGLTGIQLKMLSEISKIYGVPFSETRARSIVTSLLGGILPTGLGAGALGLVAAIPFVGVWLMPATIPLLSGAATYAVGNTLISHLESGGTVLDFDALGAKELFAERFKEGKAEAGKVASSINAKLSSTLSI